MLELPEDRFIVTASRLVYTDEHIRLLRGLVTGGLDWDAVVAKAVRHGVAGLLCYALQQHGLKALVPSEVYGQLRTVLLATAVKNEGHKKLLRQVAEWSGEKIVPLKGSDLIERVYPHPGVRPKEDVDILVRREVAQKVFAVLDGRGESWLYRNGMLACPSKSVYHDRAHSCQEKHLRPVCFSEGMVEIHGSLFRGDAYADLLSRVWEYVVPFQGCTALVFLRPEFLLLHLALHLADDAQRVGLKLRMLCDINEVVLKYADELDWEYMKELVFLSDIRHALEFALTLTHTWFGCSLPDEYLLPVKEVERYSSLDALIVPMQSGFERRMSVIGALPSLRERFFYLYKTAFPDQAWVDCRYPSAEHGGVRVRYVRYWKDLLVRML